MTQVKQILDKICAQNDAIHGALVRSHNKLYHNFTGIYEMIDIANVTDLAEQALMLTRSLEAGNNAFNSVFFEYDQHSLLVRQIDGGLFILLTAPIDKAIYKKMKIGTNLHIKKLCIALEEANRADAASEQIILDPAALNGHSPEQAELNGKDNPTSETEVPVKKKRFYRGQWY